jgi:hypothetical protein
VAGAGAVPGGAPFPLQWSGGPSCRTRRSIRCPVSPLPVSPRRCSIRCRRWRRPGSAASRLPVSLRIVLEALLRHCDGQRCQRAARPRTRRVAAACTAQRRDPLRRRARRAAGLHRRAAALRPRGDAPAWRRRSGRDPRRIEPLVPVDLVVDHSVQVDHYGTPQALEQNMRSEFERNRERYQFMKWGMQAFDTFRVVPPGVGIVHQVNLEHLFAGVRQQARRATQPVFSRHAGRYRLAHDDDQRRRRRRLGRRRHRGRGGDARPAGVLPHPGRGRRRTRAAACARGSPPPTWC